MIRSPLNAAACRKDEALSHADDIGGSQLQTIRAQLILPEQQDLFDYWRSKSGDGSSTIAMNKKARHDFFVEERYEES